MKHVIDGLMYDTETATFVGNFDNGLSTGDFRFVDESLYRTETGRYFLAGAGGAMTRYATQYGDQRSAEGESIIPLDAHEALEWCEQHRVDADVIAEHFEVEAA